MEMIQNAYQGFAKQNYTMLDNLKLGYGGTASEMYRLLQRAAELDEEFAKTANFSIDSKGHLEAEFADITQAIHIVQTEMGITGTTALEAGRTISGSVGAMKSAWTNLVTGLADGNADIGQLVDNLVTTIVGDGTESNLGVFGNILPAVEKAINGVGKLVEKLVPQLVERIPKLLTDTVPNLIKAAINTMKSVVKSIGKNAKIIVKAAKDLVLDFIDGMVDMLPDVIDAAIELLTGIIEAIPDVVVNIGKNIPKIIEAIVTGLAKGTGAVAKAIVGLFVPFDDQAEEASKKLDLFLESVVPFSEKVNEAARKTVDLTNALSNSGKTASEIEKEIDEAEEKITEILKKAFENQDGLRQADIKKIQEYNAKILQLEEEKLSIYQGQQLAEVRKTQLALSNLSPSEAAESLGAAEAALKASNEVVDSAYSDRIIMIENRHKAADTINSDAYKNDLKAAKEWADKQKNINQDYYDEVLKMVSERSEDWIETDTKKWKKLGEARLKTIKWNNENIRSAFNIFGLEFSADINESMASGLGQYDAAVAKYAEAFKKLDIESTNAFLKLQADLKKSGAEIEQSNVEAIEAILSAFGGLPEDMNEEGKKTLLKLIEGMEETIPELKNASDMTVEEIIEVLDKKLVQESTFKDYGGNIVDGITKGIVAGTNALKKAAELAANAIKNEFADKMEIHSPSKVFKRFGKNMVDGLVIGWEDNIEDMKDAIDNSLNFDDEYEVLSSSTSIRDFGTNSQMNNVSQSIDIKVGIDDSANAMGLARALLPFLKIAEKEVYA